MLGQPGQTKRAVHYAGDDGGKGKPVAAKEPTKSAVKPMTEEEMETAKWQQANARRRANKFASD